MKLPKYLLHTHVGVPDVVGVHTYALRDRLRGDQSKELVVDLDAKRQLAYLHLLLELEAGLKGVPVVPEHGVEVLLESLAQLLVLLPPVILHVEGTANIESGVKLKDGGSFRAL